MNVIVQNNIRSLLRKLVGLKERWGKSAGSLTSMRAMQPLARRGLLLLYALLALLVTWTWAATADVLIDFGRELYVPWQLNEGKTLYRDIAYFNGPLSPNFNALIFRLFGDSVVTLIVANTILLASLVTILYSVLLRYFSVVASTMACGCMVVVFGVAHMTPHGNYNYITPYSHELTHGLLLAFAVLALLRYDTQFKPWKWAMAGGLWGLVFLGKAELFLAVTTMLACSLVLPLMGKQLSLRQVFARAVTAAGFAVFPVAGFWWLLCLQTNPNEALLNLLAPWRHMFTSEVTSLYYYRHMLGTSHLTHNALTTLRACVAIGSVVFGLYALGRNLGGRGWKNPIAAAAFAFAFYLSGNSAFVLHARAFFAIAIVTFLTFAWIALRRSDDFQKHHHLACWAAFALCIMFKIALRPNLIFYGFALTMPVVVLTIATAVDWLPKVLSADGVGRRLRLALIMLLVADATAVLSRTAFYTHRKNFVLGSGRDSLRCTEKQGAPLKAAMGYLDRRMSPDDTLLVLPEGISLNYLLRRETNSPYVNFMQPELVMYGEENILADLRSNPSDFVLLVTRNVAGYGLDHFGQAGYGDKIMKWIRTNYVVEKQFGADPFEPQDFGVQILYFGEAFKRQESLGANEK